MLDDFSGVARWQAAPADGVQMRVSTGPGRDGSGLQFDFDFQDHGGWASAVLPLKLTLPDNFALEFDIRGSAPVNKLEIKLIDQSGENVWWKTYPQFEFPKEWTRLRLKRRHFRHAWGPNPEQSLDSVSAIEITVAAGKGGQGTVLIDELTLTPLEKDRPYDLDPRVRASSSVGTKEPETVFQENGVAGWRSVPDDATPWLEIDFLRRREFGGLILNWNEEDFARDYQISTSDDGQDWKVMHTVRSSNGARDYLPMPETDTRFLRLNVLRSSGNHGVGILHLEVAPLEFGESVNNVFQQVAEDSPLGDYPKYFRDEQSYWTVVGVDGGQEEALLNEQGMVELGSGSFSVEPILKFGDSVKTWHDADCRPSLEDDYLPIPSVTWHSLPVELQVTALAHGGHEDSTLYVRYLLTNRSDEALDGALLLAVRPFQVNPPWQFLGAPGGVSRIYKIAFDGPRVTVNGERTFATIPSAAEHLAATFDEGGAMAAVRDGTGKGRDTLSDASGLASGVLRFPFSLAAGTQQAVLLESPFQQGGLPTVAGRSAASFEELLKAASERWQAKLDGFDLSVPNQKRIAQTLKTTLAYTLINRDGPGIQPGSRSYERSWIRDGSLTAAALLRLGQFEVVREFLLWYAPFQFDSGKVPCCVDERGADSVPENDSHGQLIYAIAEYHRFTHDDKLLRELWPHIQAAVEYIRELRQQRMTEEYRSPAMRAFYGLVPESISHEGYSAKPMHSYWDDFFVLRGLKDAVYVAQQLGENDAAKEFAELRDEFRVDLSTSVRATMKNHDIDYVPGCVELGDFDATSSTIIVSPCDEIETVPRAALENTFDKYWSDFVARRDGSRDWEAYTPYEWRVVGTLVRLGQKERAHEVLEFFFQHQRPPEWNHWAEVVFFDRDAPKFVGDMPHTWVGSDFIRSMLDMFAYDRESDQSLVIGAGISQEWLSEPEGISIRGLHTHGGELAVRWTGNGRDAQVRIAGKVRVPSGGIHVCSPLSGTCSSAAVDGKAADLVDGNCVIVRKLPIVVYFKH